MTTGACLLAILIGASIGPSVDVQPLVDQDGLVSSGEALAGVEQLSVAVVLRETGSIDAASVKARIVEKLGQAGIKHAESETRLDPLLVVRIEGTAVPDCGKYVYRVQTSLTRLVTLPNRPDRQIQAEVWQGKPAMEAVAKTGVAEVVSTVVHSQVEAFIAAHKAARSPSELTQGAPTPAASGGVKPNSQNPQTVAGYPFVSSKNSQVFHRPDCRWAQNIATGNRIGYKSREGAVQAGMRPCKTCKP